ncbi:MAG: HAD family hydrolase [Cyclobacteriaceae bacterium]
MKPAAVIFDMDGVIVNTNPFHQKAIEQFCKKYGFQLTEEELRSRVYGRTNKDWITGLFGPLTPEQLNNYAIEKEKLFRDLYEPHIRPVDGLLDFLDQLKHASLACAIATSAPAANVDFVLKHIPIKNYFSAILDERSVTHGKPHPEIYLKTANALGLPGNQCVVIEDSLSGVASAKAAGCRVIGITTTHTPEELQETDLAVNNFSSLSVAMVKLLLSAR